VWVWLCGVLWFGFGLVGGRWCVGFLFCLVFVCLGVVSITLSASYIIRTRSGLITERIVRPHFLLYSVRYLDLMVFHNNPPIKLVANEGILTLSRRILSIFLVGRRPAVILIRAALSFLLPPRRFVLIPGRSLRKDLSLSKFPKRLSCPAATIFWYTLVPGSAGA